MAAHGLDSGDDLVVALLAKVELLEAEVAQLRVRAPGFTGPDEAAGEPADQTSSRRHLLKHGAIALGAGAAAVGLTSRPAAAAGVDPVELGQTNNATAVTKIVSTSNEGFIAEGATLGLIGTGLGTVNGVGIGVQGTVATASGVGVHGTSNGSGTIGVLGVNNGETGGIGTEGYAGSPSGIGVHGWAPNEAGTDATGVKGEGHNTGVRGEATATDGIGVEGAGLQYGVRGVNSSTEIGSVAISGEATAPFGVGVLGLADGAGGTGVLGQAGPHSFSGTGVRGEGLDGGRFIGVDSAIRATGRVIIGDDHNPPTPAAPLHVRTTGSNHSTELLVRLESTAAPQQEFLNSTSGAKWFFAMTADDAFKISRDGTGKVEAKFFANGNLQIAGTLLSASDMNVKDRFAAVDNDAILAAVEELEIRTWSYKSDPDVTHIGPTAQDFAAAFGIGHDDTTIATVDADGVALAAIQALAAEVRRLRAEVNGLRA